MWAINLQLFARASVEKRTKYPHTHTHTFIHSGIPLWFLFHNESECMLGYLSLSYRMLFLSICLSFSFPLDLLHYNPLPQTLLLFTSSSYHFLFSFPHFFVSLSLTALNFLSPLAPLRGKCIFDRLLLRAEGAEALLCVLLQNKFMGVLIVGIYSST